ncbi:MAG TPA: DegT/DnrJ/EryC1/StrS family aminotransferase [Tepidisphaeraceae bacterium]|jgi:dTDP-4-amino-4,6-dideoxygalactose transaminase
MPLKNLSSVSHRASSAPSSTASKAFEPVRSKDRFLVFGSPAIEEPEIAEVVASMRGGWLGTGPKVAQFERDFGAYRGGSEAAAHCVAVSSCTAALHLSMLAAGLKPGDEVITTPLTFCATVNAIIHAGATPVLADIDPATMNIDPDEVAKKVTSKTRAILPVHFAGRACEMDALLAIAQRHDLHIIEDCAHAIETEYKGRNAGTFGDFGCFSFYVTKNIVTGEGGMVLARDEQHAADIKVLALHGMTRDAWNRFSDAGYKHYDVVNAGFKYNMMDLQAAMGIHQLRRVEINWKRRQEIWKRYDAAFAKFPLALPAPPAPNTRHAYHLYTVRVDPQLTGVSRDRFIETMTGHNIGVGVHYRSIPEHPYYQQTFGWKPEEYPHAMQVGRETVSLPLSPRLSDEDVEDVIEAVRRTIESPMIGAAKASVEVFAGSDQKERATQTARVE